MLITGLCEEKKATKRWQIHFRFKNSEKKNLQSLDILMNTHGY